MMPHCSHKIPWHLSCSRCHAEELAWDPSSIDKLFRSFDTLDVLHARLGNWVSDSDKSFQFAINCWAEGHRRWWEMHGREDDLGGEA